MHAVGAYPDFISAHATSTPNGDIAEASVIYDTVGGEIPVVAFKRMIGHTITASGIIELIFCLYQMKHGFIVSNGTIDRDPELKPINLPKEQLEVQIDSFIKNAFGFGGLNSVLGVVQYV
jgi:3-oxoacyl-(acyl-carrier-protein) synthase